MAEYLDIDWNDCLIIGVLMAIFLLICYPLYWFTLDDAYITLRYSKHLANGNGIVWNVGADPVEGYTSFLWVLIGAIPHSLNIPPVDFLKLISTVSTLLAATILYFYARNRGIDRSIVAVATAQLLISPAIAVLTIQGMETMTTMLIVLIASISAIELTQEFKWEWAILLNIALFIGMLTRPDIVVFAILLEAGLAAVFYFTNRQAEIRVLVGVGFVLVFIPGVAYMYARYVYFGHLFPNPFYIKSGLSLRGPKMIFEFVMLVCGPLIFVSLATLRLQDRIQGLFLQTFPVLSGILGFLVLHLYITPIQGYLWRFQAPIFASLLLILVLILNISYPKIKSFYSVSNTLKTALTVMLIFGLTVYPLFTAPAALAETSERTQGDRVVMGKALESLENKGYKMFVTESGAIPYYSEWNTTDYLGLNSEKIAHNGLTKEYLAEYEPDLIQMLVDGQPGMIHDDWPITSDYLNDSSYKLIAVVHKQNRDGTNIQPDRFHLYFVNTESNGYHEISCQLITQDLKYADSEVITVQSSLNITSSDISRTDCPS